MSQLDTEKYKPVYQPPKVVDFGNVEALTASGSMGGAENNSQPGPTRRTK